MVGRLSSLLLLSSMGVAAVPSEYPHPCVSKMIVREIEGKINDKINGLDVYEGDPGDVDRPSNASSSFDKADFIGGAVRLSFHDAGTWDKDSKDAGPDGCLLMSDEDNNGLGQVVRELIEPLYEPYKKRMSRADFWALAANTALTNAAASVSRLQVPFNYGRLDCDATGTWDKSTIDTGRLPHADAGWDHVKEIFVTRMGLSVQDIVALMGAHSLGRTDKANSGFEGPWVVANEAHIFDADYYQSMIDQPWIKGINDAGTPQWKQDGGVISRDTPMMLNVDIAMIISNADSPNCTDYISYEEGPGDYKIVSGQFGPNPGCTYSEETGALAFAYRNATKFFPAFIEAFQKLQELGWGSEADDRGALLPPGTCFDGKYLLAIEEEVEAPTMKPAGGGVLVDEVDPKATVRPHDQAGAWAVLCILISCMALGTTSLIVLRKFKPDMLPAGLRPEAGVPEPKGAELHNRI